MIPLLLQLNNFMSYRTPTSIDFSGIHTACLSGDNGAGKSALLDAMTWAVWGKSRAAHDRDVVTIGASQMEVTFDFRLNDREYRVFRRRTLGSRANISLEFYVRDSPDEEWLPISADSVRETNQAIVSTLKMDYETFVNSAFLMQGQADAFTQKGPTDRKKLLADILNLGDYDILSGMARDEERTLRGRSGQLVNLIARLDEQLARRPEVEFELERISRRLIKIGGQVDSLETDARELQDTLNSLGGLTRNRDDLTTRVARQTQRLKELEAQLSANRNEMQQLKVLIDRGDEIERSYRDLLHWREVAESCAAILRQRQPVEAQLRETEREIERARSDAQRQIDQFRNTESQARSAILELGRRESELENLLRETASIEKDIEQLDRLPQQLREAEAEKTTLETECRALKHEMNEIRKNLDLLEGGGAECPICRRPMNDGEHEHVRTLWIDEGTVLGNRFREHRDRIKELEILLPELSTKLKKLEKLRTRHSERHAVIQRIKQELTEKPKLERQAADASSEADRLSMVLSNGAFAPELTAKARDLSAQLEKLTYDAEEAIAADEQIQRLRGVEKEHGQLQTARVQYAAIETSITEREQAAEELRGEIAAMNEQLAEIHRQLEDEPALRERLAAIMDDLERIRAERDEVQGAFGAAENQLAHLDRLAEEHAAHKAEIGSLMLDADAYHELGVAFGRNGIQAMVVETILPEIEDEANRLLARMTTSHLHVDLRSTREALSNDNIIETLDIIIRDESGERPYALYSGGEAFRIDFAIRVALSKLLVRRAGTTIDMLIVDEGFGTQDARGRDGLIEALQSVESDFATILVITHIDEVRDMFPTRIEVTKTDAGSQVVVV